MCDPGVGPSTSTLDMFGGVEGGWWVFQWCVSTESASVLVLEPKCHGSRLCLFVTNSLPLDLSRDL